MTKVFPTRWYQRGSIEPSLKKTTFPADFVMNTTLYIYTFKRIISKQKKEKKSEKNTVSKMAAKLPIFALRHFNFSENLKNHFSKGIFNEIWLIIGDYKYIYITETKFGNFYSCGILGAKHFSRTPPKC